MDNYLQHYGVLGMKWGVRRSKVTSKGVIKSQTSKSEDHIRAKALKKKKLSQLSNDEIRELNIRIQLENQYRSLKKQRVSAGKKIVQDVAYESSKSLASDYTKKYAKKGISYIGKFMKKKVKEK